MQFIPLIKGTLASTFSINSGSGVITTTSKFDYEMGLTSYGDGTVATLGIKATDGNGGSATVPITVTVNNINDPPSFGAGSYTGSVDEEKNTGETVTLGTAVTSSDPEGDTRSYSLVGKSFVP